jgi:hypothetical protein
MKERTEEDAEGYKGEEKQMRGYEERRKGEGKTWGEEIGIRGGRRTGLGTDGVGGKIGSRRKTRR